MSIPALGVAAPVTAVGLDGDGALAVPADVTEVGWYEPVAAAGVVPGGDGTAVLAGHVSSRTLGPGAFHGLHSLREGDMVEVEHADGSRSDWRVTSVARTPKSAVDLGEVFTWAGPPRLALITCGGVFDRATGSHRDNVIVLAVPAGG